MRQSKPARAGCGAPACLVAIEAENGFGRDAPKHGELIFGERRP
jgi:hypothetical protein